MTFDEHANFAISRVSTKPDPEDSGTELDVEHPELFPTPPFNVTVWPNNKNPLASNAEIVRVTDITDNTFTIQRQCEGTPARSIKAGDNIANAITKKWFTDIENAGSQTIFGDYIGNPVTIADGAGANLTWDSFSVGTPLLDLTTPAAPLFLADGWYDVQAQISVSGLTAAGWAYVQIGATSSGPSSPNVGYITAAQVADEAPLFLSGIVVIRALVPATAGDNLQLTATNHDGAASRDFAIRDALLVKIA